MEYNNQKIIFLVPEETTPVEIILDILETSGIKDADEDLADEGKTPKLLIILNTTKDFFDKKISEEKMSELFQQELKISKESATEIISGVKEKLIPFAKKINVPADGPQTSVTENVIKVETPLNIIRPVNKLEEMKLPADMNKKIQPPAKPKIKKLPEMKTVQGLDVRQNRKPDNYREPIE